MQLDEAEFSIERMLKLFGVSRSDYYKFINANVSNRALANEILLTKIKYAQNS